MGVAWVAGRAGAAAMQPLRHVLPLMPRPYVAAGDAPKHKSNVNKRAQVFLFAWIFYDITFTYKLKHLRFQLTWNENC